MRIIPLSELRDTKTISELITTEKKPIFVTKQGSQHLVIVPHDLYVEMEKALNQ